MERKIFECPFNLKQVTETGQFEGHAAVFSNVDLQGDKHQARRVQGHD